MSAITPRKKRERPSARTLTSYPKPIAERSSRPSKRKPQEAPRYVIYNIISQSAESSPRLLLARIKKLIMLFLYYITTHQAKKRKQLIEVMQARWVSREIERMQTAVLEKKGLRGEELERRREPVLRMKQEASDKEARRRAVIGRAAELFEDALASNFPLQQAQKLLTAATVAAVSKTTKKPLVTGDLISLHTADTGDV